MQVIAENKIKPELILQKMQIEKKKVWDYVNENVCIFILHLKK